MDFAFLVLRLKSLEAQYSADLRQRLRFNTQLGYRIFRQEQDGFVRASVTAEEYFTCAATFRRAAVLLHGATADLADADGGFLTHLQQEQVAARGDFQFRTIPISTS